jgi:protein SCO1/2
MLLRYLAVVCALAALAGCDGRPALPSYGLVPDFTLTAQDGSTFHSLEKLSDKVWIADFIFTNCTGPCPMMTSRMHRLSERLANQKDLRFVSISIDPERDTPQAMADFARRYRADTARWYFLTGTRDALHYLNRKVFMLGDVDGSLEHSTRFVLVDRKGRIRGYYDSNDRANIEQLVQDIGRVI